MMHFAAPIGGWAFPGARCCPTLHEMREGWGSQLEA
jgi:hypothetical protein